MKIIGIAATCVALSAGCAGNTKFVYKPSAPAPGVATVPVKIAVLPFRDGTGNYTIRGQRVFASANCTYNLAKAGNPERIDPLPPEFWSKAFADELAASARFETVRFLYDRTELTDEEILVDGTLVQADLSCSVPQKPHEFALSLRAQRRADSWTAWERDVRKSWNFPPGMEHACNGSFEAQCYITPHHANVNRAMQEMFAEAGADLARALAPLAGGGTGVGADPKGASPEGPAPESLDETIESILKGK